MDADEVRRFYAYQGQQVMDTHAAEYAEDIRATMRRMGCRDIPGETKRTIMGI